jgi:hypothetical protein
MGERSNNLARSRKRAATRTPTTLLGRTHESCRVGLHLWCPGTAGKTDKACLCACHTGRKVPAPGVES